jgi:hypothetical protein
MIFHATDSRRPAPFAAWLDTRVNHAQEARREQLLERNGLQALGQAMRKLLAALDRYDFSGVLQPPGRWARLTGRDVLEEVQFRVAHREVRDHMAQAQRCADAQMAWAAQWLSIVQGHEVFVQELAERIRIEAQLMQQQQAGPARDASERQIQNAQVMLTSARLTAQQFALLQSQHDTVLTRFQDIKHKLMPLWLDQMTALLHGRALDAGHLQAAVKTYSALSAKLRTELTTPTAVAEPTP